MIPQTKDVIMRAVICGSRSITCYNIVEQAISESGFVITAVVSGCAPGVDRLGERWARENKKELFQFPADWNRYGSRAGFIRNKQMVDFVSPDGCVIAVWDGVSKGTLSTIELSKEKNIKLYVKEI